MRGRKRLVSEGDAGKLKGDTFVYNCALRELLQRALDDVG